MEETARTRPVLQVAGSLPICLPVSAFAVTPVLAWWRGVGGRGGDPPRWAEWSGSPAELVEPANRFQVAHPSGYVGPGFAVRGRVRVGFTAGLLSRLLQLARWSGRGTPTLLPVG